MSFRAEIIQTSLLIKYSIVIFTSLLRKILIDLNTKEAKKMKYQSTRGISNENLMSAQIIKQGLARDGGLFIPEEIPTLSLDEIKSLCADSYPVRAAKILSKYLTDYTYQELLADCEAAYCKKSFPDGAAPLVKVRDNIADELSRRNYSDELINKIFYRNFYEFIKKNFN